VREDSSQSQDENSIFLYQGYTDASRGEDSLGELPARRRLSPPPKKCHIQILLSFFEQVVKNYFSYKLPNTQICIDRKTKEW
jgi:hypothetical protein